MASGCKFCGDVFENPEDYQAHLVNAHADLAHPAGIPPALEHLVKKKSPGNPNPDGSQPIRGTGPQSDREGDHSGMDADRRVETASPSGTEEGTQPAATTVGDGVSMCDPLGMGLGQDVE